VLLKLEKILQTNLSLDKILENFKTVNKKQMQDWLKLAIELRKVKKLEKPVRYIWYSVDYQDYSHQSRIGKQITVMKSQLNETEETTQLSLI